MARSGPGDRALTGAHPPVAVMLHFNHAYRIGVPGERELRAP